MKVLITGASTGIGAAFAQRAVLEGYQVFVIGQNLPAWAGADQITFAQIDLSSTRSLEVELRQFTQRYGPFDIVVGNAGRGSFGQLESLSSEEILTCVNLNLVAQIFLARAVLPSMKKVGTGTLVYVGSEASVQGAKNGSVYCATKFALRGLVQSLRADCASSGVRVSILLPGMVDTPFFDDLWFRPGTGIGQALSVQSVAETLWHVCHAPPGAVIDEVRINPQVKVIQKKPGPR